MNKPNKSKNYRLLLGVLTIVAIAAIALAFSLIPTNQRVNYAESTAAPIEEALVKAGAVKKCSYGDDGRGSDNQRPWYDSFYELSANRDEAIKLINEAANKNSYSLTHASTDNRGSLGSIADEYIDNWYFDNTKTSSNDDLQAGTISVALGVNNDGRHSISEISCGTKEPVVINSSEDTSMITLMVKTPEFKR